MLVHYKNTNHTGHNFARVDEFVRNICTNLNIDVDELEIVFGCIEASLPSGVEKSAKFGIAGGVNKITDRSYEIVINSTFRTGVQVISLAHELVHVAQFASGRFESLGEGKGWMWEGQYYPEDTPYKERPWEVEAHAMEEPVAKAA